MSFSLCLMLLLLQHLSQLCSDASSTTTTVTMAPASVGLAAASDQHDVVLLPLLILKDTLRVLGGLTTVPQQKSQTQKLSQAYTNYAMGPSEMSFLFSELSLPLVSVMVFALGFQVMILLQISPIRAHWLGLYHSSPSEYIHGRHMCLLVQLNGPCLGSNE